MKKKLHILFLCGWYPSKVLPTNGDFIMRHAKAVSTEHQVSVLHIISDSNISKTEIEIEKKVNFNTYIAFVKFSKNPLIKYYRFWMAYLNLLSKIGHFDIVHLHKLYPFGLFALHLKKRKQIPYIISEHWTGYHIKRKKRQLLSLTHWLSKKITTNADSVCPVSEDLRNSMQQLGLKGKYLIVPNVVDTNVFKPTPKIIENFTITHVSSLLDRHKNISGMLRVAKQLESEVAVFTWNFIGGKRDEFVDLIKELNFTKAKIHFIDHTTHQKISDYLNASHIFVLFSNYENLPCVILEAFSCGIPVISTNVGGIKEHFPDGFGCLIDKKNEQQLLEKIVELYENPINQKSKMHQYAIENFGEERICKSFTELYMRALN